MDAVTQTIIDPLTDPDHEGYYWVRHKDVPDCKPQIMRRSVRSGCEPIWLDFNDWWAGDSVEILSRELLFETIESDKCNAI